jgi:hypothetical protein
MGQAILLLHATSLRCQATASTDVGVLACAFAAMVGAIVANRGHSTS